MTPSVTVNSTQSQYSHHLTRVASTNGRLLAVGDFFHSHSEINENSTTWISQPDYPFAHGLVYASSVGLDNSFYYFGGYSYAEGLLSTIARFNGEWKLVGNLLNGRYMHGTVTLGQSFLTIGGMTGDNNGLIEECYLGRVSMECTKRTPDMNMTYALYPELFYISHDFMCTNH